MLFHICLCPGNYVEQRENRALGDFWDQRTNSQSMPFTLLAHTVPEEG